MKYIDANVLIRIMTYDIPEQAERAVAMLEAAHRDEVMLLDAVISEVCFVLEFNAHYKLPRSDIYAALCDLLNASPQIGTGICTHQALELYGAHPKLDYVDCLLWAKAQAARGTVLTFDKELLRAIG